jgi:hypothetical protein
MNELESFIFFDCPKKTNQKEKVPRLLSACGGCPARQQTCPEFANSQTVQTPFSAASVVFGCVPPVWSSLKDGRSLTKRESFLNRENFQLPSASEGRCALLGEFSCSTTDCIMEASFSQRWDQSIDSPLTTDLCYSREVDEATGTAS